MATNKLRAVKGQLPTKREIIDWPEEKLMALLRFAQVFIEGDGFKVTSDTRKIAESRAQDEAFWPEFLIRIDRPLGTEQATHQNFRIRLMTLLRIPLAWLKENSFAITDDLRAVLETSKRFSWCLTSFAAKETKIGGEIVVMENRETTDPQAANKMPNRTNVSSPQVTFNQELLNMTSIMKLLLQDIKIKQIKEMGTKDRIKTAVAIAATLTKTFERYKPNPQVFQQININQAGRADLERMLSDYQDSQVIDDE